MKYPFVLMGLVAAALAVISLFPASSGLYTSWPMIALWAILAAAGIAAMIYKRLWRRPLVFALHVALLVILGGAAVTHFFGSSATVHLRIGETAEVGGHAVTLEDFNIDYYPGTRAPRDFISTIAVDGNGGRRLSVNNVADVDGMRIFQSACDSDGRGSTLTISVDAAGTAVTYFGYGLLFLTMALLSLPHRLLRRFGLAAVLAICGAATADAATPTATLAMGSPKALPADVAEAFDSLCVDYNGRIAPFSTLARDFTVKISGSDSFSGLNAEQVLTGWLFYYDYWKSVPCIRIKKKASREALGIDGKMVSVSDFFDSDGSYRLGGEGHAEANAIFSLISQAATGSLWKMFPAGTDADIAWYSPVDDLPAELDTDQWRTVRHSLGLLASMAAANDWAGMRHTVGALARYQERVSPQGSLPSPSRRRAERAYIAVASSPAGAVTLAVAAIVLMFAGNARLRRFALVLAAVFVASMIALCGFASGRIPMANGMETMMWMSLLTILVTLTASRRYPDLLAPGLLCAALALAVAVMGHASPQTGPLMPVLRSPLLSIHVFSVMAAYALMALMAVCGVATLAGRPGMLAPARAMLRPAVFLMAAGIFIGAIWANNSWGRYWGWDPKEVWALITMMIYAIPLHTASLPAFRRRWTFAWWTVAAFACVLITYFGVNFLLPGLHSYA